MTRRAMSWPGAAKHNLLSALGMGLAVILLGCGGGGGGNGGGGGGGGGGGNPGACGSPAGSTTTILCGYVVQDSDNTTRVAGATVTLKSANGTTVASTQTDAAGFYKFNSVPNNTALFQVDAPAQGYYLYYFTFNAGKYYSSQLSRDGSSPCIPSVGSLVAGDTQLGTVAVRRSADPPPAPVFQTDCPR